MIGLMSDNKRFNYPPTQRFPDDGLGTVVRNVFDFDGYSKEVTILLVLI